MNEVVISNDQYKLSLRQDTLIIKNTEGVIEKCISLEKIEAISIYGNPRISTQLIKKLGSMNIGLYYYNHYGDFLSELNQYKSANYLDQWQQFTTINNPAFRLQMAKILIKNKILTQINLLKAYNKDKILISEDFERMYESYNKLDFAQDLNQIMGLEGRVAKSYFYYLGLVVPYEFKFRGRSKRPAKDSFNVMLNIGYHLLYRHIHGAIVKYGLNPGIGIIHQTKRNHAALASDLMEEWRTIIVDDVVLKSILNGEITPNMFEIEDSGRIRIDKQGHKILRENIRMRMLEQHHYLLAHKKYYTCSYTINLQIESLKRCFDTQDPTNYLLLGDYTDAEMV